LDSDISLSTLKGSSGYLGAFPGFTAETSERWLATYRGRLGLKFGEAQTWMAYVTGGGASAAIKITATEPGAGIAEGVVVGSALVGAIAQSLDGDGRATSATKPQVLGLVGRLAAALRHPAEAAAL